MLLLKIIFVLMLMYAFFRIATWLNDSDNQERVWVWLLEHLDSSGSSNNGDSDSDGGSSDSGSSGGDGGGGGGGD